MLNLQKRGEALKTHICAAGGGGGRSMRLPGSESTNQSEKKALTTHGERKREKKRNGRVGVTKNRFRSRNESKNTNRIILGGGAEGEATAPVGSSEMQRP